MKVITLLNEKGGVGKTTLATHIAAGLAIRGARVVLMDSDPQGHATISMGLQKQPTFHDLLVRGMGYDEALVKVNGAVLSNNSPRGELFIVPTDHSARVIPLMTDDANIVYKRVNELRNFADYVIFDTSPTPSLLHAAIFRVTDYYIHPTKSEYLSFDGLANSIQRPKQIERPDGKPAQTLGIVPTMYRQNVGADEHALNMARQAFGDTVWDPLTLRTIWTQASFAQRVLFKYAPEHEATAQVWGVVNRVAAV